MAARRRRGTRAVTGSALSGRDCASGPESGALRIAHHRRRPQGGHDASQKERWRTAGRTTFGLRGVIETLPRSILSMRERVGLVARAIEPILNRVVLVGPPVVDLLMTDPAVRVPDLSFVADCTLQLLST